LDRKDSLVVVKFLLPRVDITGKLKLKDFNLMKKCVVWLAEIARGMTWDEHMTGEQWEVEGKILGEDLRFEVGCAAYFFIGRSLMGFFSRRSFSPYFI
jgi:hypothetical protein